MAALLGIDQGTTGTKAIVFDERLRPGPVAYRPVRRDQPRPDWVEQDPHELVESVVATAAAALERAGGPDVAGVGLANQGETVVAWDADDGEPLAPALVWQDSRSQGIVDRLRADGLEEEVRAISGLPLDPYFSSTKLTWLLAHCKPVAEAARRGTLRLGTSDAYLRAALGGDHATDPATASRTQLMSLDTLDWDDRLLEIFGVPREALPEILPTTGALGPLAHRELPAGLQLTAAIVDQQAALAGHGCAAPGETKCTYGTGCFMLAHAGTERPDAEPLLPTVAWVLDGQVSYALEGGVLSAGTCVDWLAGLGLAADGRDLDRLAAEADSAGGVRFLPAFSGLGAPWWDSEARGVFSGLTAGATPAHLARAVFDGIAWSVRDLVDAIAARTSTPTELRVDGGLTAGETLMRRQADVLGIPLLRARTADTTALGAAALAGIGAGLIAGVEAIAGLLEPPERIEPSLSGQEAEEQYAGWRRFVAGARAV